MRGSSADNSEMFNRYLLGQLSDTEAAALEERYFADDEAFAGLEVAADDLADRYVAGDLSSTDRAQFERHCLGSGDDRMRTRVASALRRYAAQHPPQKRPSLLSSLIAAFAVQGMGVRAAAAAAALVMVVGASMLTLRTLELRNELNRVRRGMSEELTAERASSARAIQQERAQRESLEQRLRDLTTSSFVLIPGLDRASGTDLVVARSSSYVRFDLAIERLAPSGRYRVTLRSVERATLWSQDVTALRVASPSVQVTIPASVVGTGQLEIVLQQLDGAGATSEIATYGFRIVRER